MAWIEAHQELAHHPKVRRLARELGVPKAQAIGHLLMLWLWAVSYAKNGCVEDVEDVAVAADWPVAEADWFAKTLEQAGFLDAHEGGWWIHDWSEYAGKAVEATEARRRDGEYGNHVRWHKNTPKADCQWCSPPDRPPISPPDRVANRTAQHITEQDTTAAAPTFPQLLEVAKQIVDERIADGYQVGNRDAFVRSIARSEEAKHRWLKAQPARSWGDELGMT